MLEKKIPQRDLDLVFCDWNECKQRGEYTRCYFDLYVNCPFYITHQKYLKKIKELKNNS